MRALETIAAAFPTDCEGVLIAVGRSVRLALFPNAWLLSRARPVLLRAAAFEALSSTDRGVMDGEDAERFLREVAGLDWARGEPVGLGFQAWAYGPDLEAGALFLGGALVHLSAVRRPVRP